MPLPLSSSIPLPLKTDRLQDPQAPVLKAPQNSLSSFLPLYLKSCFFYCRLTNSYSYVSTPPRFTFSGKVLWLSFHDRDNRSVFCNHLLLDDLCLCSDALGWNSLLPCLCALVGTSGQESSVCTFAAPAPSHG